MLLAAFFSMLIAIRAAAAEPATNPPEALLFNETAFDLGDIPDDRVCTHVFHFTNISGHTIRLAVSGCGLFAIPVVDKPFYRPGESGTITVTFNPAGRNGPVTRVYSVQPIDLGEPNPALQITEPLADLGDIADGQPCAHTFRFTNISSSTIELKLACHLDCTIIADRDRYPPGESGTLTVTFHPTGLRGRVTRAFAVRAVPIPDPP